MVEIVGVGFAKTGKTYYFDPVGKTFELGDMVIVETARGMELGHILIANREIDESELVAELKPVERKATDADLKKYHENLAKREDALRVCAEKIEKHGLDMKLIDVEFMIDGSKIVFYFSADGRVDFRELAKDLAGHFKNRIELMAKQQNLSLNPSKISGTCGRLMCCLNFEDKTYKELRKGMPKDNERVETPDGLAKVVNVDYFNGKINTRAIEKDPETGEEVFSQEIHSFGKDEIRRIGRNAGKERTSEVDDEEIRELEELMREF